MTQSRELVFGLIRSRKVFNPIMFINLSNHPSDRWSEEQLKAAQAYGEIREIPFPNVDPESPAEVIQKQAEELVERVLDVLAALKSPDSDAVADADVVMCQGEFTLCYRVVTILKEHGIRVVAACTERNVRMDGDQKISIFRFVQFREY